jgi:hypothetical protein
VAWIEKRHREGSPTLADGDVMDLLRHDLPQAVAVVENWAAQVLDQQLAAAITQAWEAQDYDGAIRDGVQRARATHEGADGWNGFRARARG